VKCLFICTALDVGGIETYLLRLIRYLKTQGSWETHVLCKAGRVGTLGNAFLEAGAVIHPIKQGYVDPVGWVKLLRLLRQERFDAVCDFTGNFAGIPLTLASWSGTPIRISFLRQSKEFFEPTLLRNCYWRFSKSLVSRYATVVLSNSATALQNFWGKVAAHAGPPRAVVANAVEWRNDKSSSAYADEVRRELNVPDGAPIVGHVGRFLPEKNHGAILDVAELFMNDASAAIFLLIGRGVESALQAEVRRRGLTNLRFLGERNDVLDLLTIMDAFYFPSTSEGQPNALLEAAATGIPFVASDIPEIKACFPPWWKERWLVAPNHVAEAAELLRCHVAGVEMDELFGRVVEWVRDENSQERRFEELAVYLRGGFMTPDVVAVRNEYAT
jgi:glycosyltransferase involved in cell wall biosynthesis